MEPAFNPVLDKELRREVYIESGVEYTVQVMQYGTCPPRVKLCRTDAHGKFYLILPASCEGISAIADLLSGMATLLPSKPRVEQAAKKDCSLSPTRGERLMVDAIERVTGLRPNRKP